MTLDTNKRFQNILWWIAALALFIGLFATAPRLYYVMATLFNQMKNLGFDLGLDPAGEKARFLREVVAPIKGVVFLLAMSVLGTPLIEDIWSSRVEAQIDYKRLFWSALFYLLVIATFTTSKGLSGGNLEYADQSGVVFEKGNDVWLYQRFLMPAVAYVLFLRGQFFYLFFSILCILTMMYVGLIWLESNGIHLKHWQLISLFSSGFVFVKLQYPGSPDVFVHLFLLMLFAFPLGELAQLSLIAFSLASHEASIFLFAAIALFFRDGKLRLKVFALIFSYLLIWLISIQFDIASLWYTPQVRGLGALGTILANPSLLFLGVFYADKLAWILIIVSSILLVQRKDYHTLLQILSLIGVGLFMSLIGVDTIRMFSWSFFTIFMAVRIIYQENSPRLLTLMNMILILNLLIPPLYADLHGVRMPSGIYGILYSWIGL